MGSMPHKPPLNYGWHIRMLQGLAATIDKDERIPSSIKVKVRDLCNALTVLLAQG